MVTVGYAAYPDRQKRNQLFRILVNKDEITWLVRRPSHMGIVFHKYAPLNLSGEVMSYIFIFLNELALQLKRPNALDA